MKPFFAALSSPAIAILALLSLVASPADASAVQSAERLEIGLNGEWESAVTTAPVYPPLVEKWRSVEVPCMEYGGAIQGTRYVWYRREVEIPASFKGKKIALLLYGARFNASVFCDGNLIASRLEGFTPFRIDLTGRVTPGKSCRLEIRCQDWSAVFKDDYKLPPDANPDSERLRGVPKGRLIAPIGGLFYLFGIWDDVALVARPPTHCDDVAVITSVRNGNTLTVNGEIVGGRPGLRIEGAVTDRGKTVLTLPGRGIEKDNHFNLSASFPKPRYWSPEDPHLYTLVLSLSDAKGGAVLDRFETRFGFRELWAEGPDLYLNGVKRHLLASSGWPLPRYQNEDEIRRAIASIRASNAVAFRLHTQPWQRRWLDLADELGLMIVEEGALWCDGGGGYAYADEKFWENVQTHLDGMVRRDRNHPSLIMWSIENEILHCGALRYCSCAEDRLAEAGRRVKALDPTHLITFEADHDPGGAADVIGLHYPRELPENVDYPNTADWLDKTITTGTAGGTAGSWNKDFFWDRKKPLYIGEYLWVFRQDFSAGSVFFGDDAYLDKESFRNKAKALAWEIQTAAYRRAGVSGMCPWTIAADGGLADSGSPLFAAQQKAYAPLAIFGREFDSRFFAGEKVRRDFDVLNDSGRTRKLTVRVSMPGWAKGYEESFTLESAGHRLVTITVPMPDTSAPDGLAFEAALIAGGKKINAFTARFKVFDKRPLPPPPGRTLLLYDPAATWSATGVQAKRLAKPDDLLNYEPSSSVLIVAPGTFTKSEPAPALPIIGRKDSASLNILRFLEKGGGVLVLEQESLTEFMPEMTMVEHSSTMAFPVSPTHPLLKGLAPEDLKFWRGDHRVTLREIRRPAKAGVAAVLVSGGLDAVDQAPLLEMSVGRGKIVFCQALAAAKYDYEPAARALVANAVAWLAAPRPPDASALLAAEGKDADAFRERLDEIGASCIESDPEKADVIVLHGGGDKMDVMAPFIAERIKDNRPLTVYWHAPGKASFDRLKKSLGLETASIAPAAGPIALTERTDTVLDNVLREDVTFQLPIKPDNWYREVEYDPSVIDGALDLSAPGALSDRHEIESWELSGKYVRPIPDKKAARFYSNGSAKGEITVAREGLYRLRLSAWGAPAEGIWPVVEVKADGRPAALVNVTAREPRIVAFVVRLPKGTVTLELSFINDLCRNGEDRNLFLDALLIDREPISNENLELLCLPPALVQVEPKPGLRVILDFVRWDVNEANRLRGLRFASTLLANLGVPFTSVRSDIDWIDPRFFEKAGDIAAFSRTDACLNLYSGGRVKATFTCASAGRYAVLLRGWSTPLKDVYAKAAVWIDGERIGEAELQSGRPRDFPAGSAELAAGDHELSVEFTNDEWAGPGGEDRNLYLMGAGFAAQ